MGRTMTCCFFRGASFGRSGGEDGAALMFVSKTSFL